MPLLFKHIRDAAFGAVLYFCGAGFLAGNAMSMAFERKWVGVVLCGTLAVFQVFTAASMWARFWILTSTSETTD